MTTTGSRTPLVALVLVCVALIVNAFVVSPFWILAPAEEFSDTAAVPAFAISQTASWILLTLLIPLLPALGEIDDRCALPRWIVPLTQVAVAAQAATHLVQGVVLPWLESIGSYGALDTPEGGGPQVAMVIVWVLFLVTNVAFAVALWRAGHSRVAAALMIIGAVSTPMFGPFGAGLLALGLGTIAVLALRDPAAVREPAGLDVPVADRSMR